MKPFRILIVEDDLEQAQTLREILLKKAPADVTGREDVKLDIHHAAHQQAADEQLGTAGFDGFDLVLLDLVYPERSGGPIHDETATEFQGMKWLPTLRRLQPNAAIVILTGYPYHGELVNAVQAIRRYDAHDFVPKTADHNHITSRILVACRNARYVRNLVTLEEGYHTLLRSLAGRIYAEDVGGLIDQSGSAISRIADRLALLDMSTAGEASALKAQVKALTDRFRELTEPLYEVPACRRREIDLVEVVQQVLQLHERRRMSLDIGIDAPPSQPAARIITYESDLRIALHEVVRNALDAFEFGKILREERRLVVAIEGTAEPFTLIVIDNAGGFSDTALSRIFQRGFTTRPDERHTGLGLFIARRMMDAIGGEIHVQNGPQGGAEVRLTVGSLP